MRKIKISKTKEIPTRKGVGYYRVRDAAAYLGLSPKTIYSGIYAGTIPSRRVGASRLVPATWVEGEVA